MEEHTVPQNITNFEFKLFGPFTIRQFIYVAAGGIVGAVFYFSPLPKGVSYILGAIFVFGGIGFASIPLQGRPLDKWIIAFFRSITRPTQRIWIKDNRIPYFLETSFLQASATPEIAQPSSRARLSKADLQTFLAKQNANTFNNPFDQKESQFLSQITNLASTVVATSAPPPQNQRINLTPFSPYTNPQQKARSSIQAAPKPAQLQAKEEEIKVQEFALIQNQKSLEATKIKLEEEKQKRLILLTRKTTVTPASHDLELQKRPELYGATTPVNVQQSPNENFSTPEKLNPNREIKILPYTPQAQTKPQNTQSQEIQAETLKSMQKLAELDEVLRSQKKIEAEIKAKEEEIKAQQSKIQQEQEKFTSAWEDFQKNKSIAEGFNTSTPDMLQGHILSNVGKKSTISPIPSSNFSAMSSSQSVSAQIASDINFGGNVITIPGSRIQFMQGIGDTRMRKLRTRPPDFSKATLPILGERRFDISNELKRRFEPPAPQPTAKIAPIGGIVIESIKTINDFEPKKAGEIKERDSVNFAPPPSPNIDRNYQSEKQQAQASVETQNRQVPQPKHGSIVQPFNYQKESVNKAPKAQVKINLSDHINTPNGVVYDTNGALVQGVLISVFDHSNKPVRAFKTNGLGQFISVTPLPDGHYTIQSDFDGMTFDTIAFEAIGKLLDPFAITAKN